MASPEGAVNTRNAPNWRINPFHFSQISWGELAALRPRGAKPLKKNKDIISEFQIFENLKFRLCCCRFFLVAVGQTSLPLKTVFWVSVRVLLGLLEGIVRWLAQEVIHRQSRLRALCSYMFNMFLCSPCG